MIKSRTLTINGQRHSVAISGAETLLDVLRDKLRLTGSKKGCDVGDCGACMVLIDGEAINSCLILAATLEGKSITTIEGLADNGRLTPVQNSFVHEGGTQCGFCTPGMVISATALLDKNPNPTDDEIKEGLSGNLCRCTGYTGILRAVKRCDNYRDDGTCTAGDPDGSEPRNRSGSVGVSIPRIDAADKVTGRATYTDDVHLPNMVHGKILGSSVAHGYVKRVDTSKAEALEGVLAVITGKDVTDTLYGTSPARYDEHVLAKDKVRHMGDPVAAVAAIDERTAERALSLIEVEYEELPLVSDMEEALVPGSPALHDTNLCAEHHYDWGDVEEGFAQSDRVFEDTFTFPMVYHYALEPHTSIGHYTNQGITVWSTAQHPFLVRSDLARMFGFSLHQVRIIVPYLGGGFGSKSYTKMEPLAVALSKVAGRPVRLALSVEEAFKTVRRHAARLTVKTGVKLDGTFVARECLIYLDTGAYADNGPLVAGRAGDRIAGPYRWPSLKVSSSAVYTNSTPAGSFRSIGAPQAAWASESQVDIIAHDLGIDPLEIRIKNMVSRGEEVRRGQRPLEGDPATGLRLAAEAVGWGDEEATGASQESGGTIPSALVTGKGLGCNLSGVGSSPT
ncbi:MAG: molybdopterin-dependent oxidoreductase, partial [Planctomycetes bacterium]|nr:molybdopterin-dependent oxidoreductase [Planctomycetota bacterium]